MTEKSQAELEELHQSVVKYGSFAVQMLKESINVFESGDINRATIVIMQKEELKKTFIPLEDSLFQYISLYHPVARDMREVAASIRIIYNFERVGRMGYDIAKTTTVLSECCGLRDSPNLISMGRLVTQMIEDALSAYEERSMNKIVKMQERDTEIDNLYCNILTDIIGRMQTEKDDVPVLTRYVIINRYLERCGDQACNMSEMILYMITGERVEIHS